MDKIRQHFSYDQMMGLVEPHSRVLDLGCGDGELLQRLHEELGVVGRGVDIDERMIQECLAKGISVFQGNLDEGLKDYATASYDYVILNQTLQVVHDPVMLLREMHRVGRMCIVSFPNFAYWLNRIQLGLKGRMPVNPALPYQWYNTPNIHLCTRDDFVELCKELQIPIEREIRMVRRRVIGPYAANLRATEVCYLLRGKVPSAVPKSM
jgi:methionine biosynthesis protein MetW